MIRRVIPAHTSHVDSIKVDLIRSNSSALIELVFGLGELDLQLNLGEEEAQLHFRVGSESFCQISPL